MKASRTEREDIRYVAKLLGVKESEAGKAIRSFFRAIECYSRSLPFDDRRRIYSKDAFGSFVKVFNLPYLGRIGPSYSRYLTWRKNESRRFLQESRSAYRTRVPRSEIENMARDILSGVSPAPLKKRKKSELYEQVWLVGSSGKKLARQVIPKTENDV